MTGAVQNTFEMLEIFVGEATDVEARVYARCKRPTDAAHGEVSITGTITGPYREHTRTLPAEFKFRDLGSGATLLAEAVVSDPCFWSPDAPYLYDVSFELHTGGKAVATHRQVWGLRRLGTRDCHFFLNGKRFVIRGAHVASSDQDDLTPWHTADVALFVPPPSAEMCEQASREGVLLMVDCTPVAATADLPDAIRRWARWPAVGAVVLSDVSGDEWRSLESRRDTPLVGQYVGVDQPVKLQEWASFVVCELAGAAEAAQRLNQVTIPVVGFRAQQSPALPTDVRQACDRLQRDLAPHLDLAGYVV